MIKKQERNGDRTTWIPRTEAASLLGVSVRTVQRWQGPHLRAMQVQSGRLPMTLVHRGDVERLRIARVGRTVYQTECAVLEALLAGRSPEVIVREHDVSLEEIERIRDHFVRLKDSRIIEAKDVRKMREELGLEKFDIDQVIGALRALRQISGLLDVSPNV